VLILTLEYQDDCVESREEKRKGWHLLQRYNSSSATLTAVEVKVHWRISKLGNGVLDISSGFDH